MNDDSFNGGGFNTGGGYSNDNNDGSQRTQQQQRQSLTPVTIKQINDATQPVLDGEFQVNNVALTTVSFVGVVRNVQDLTANLVITIEDGTGAIDVRKWINDSDNSSSEVEQHSQELNKYVFVTGALKEFNGKKTLQNTTIRPVTDHNEILYHNLSAISTHLKAQGITAKSAGSNLSSAGSDLFVKDQPNQGLSIQDNILSVIRDNSASLQEGVPAKLISQQLNIPNEIVIENCGVLVEEGKIYTGYDDSAYLAI